MFELAGDVYDAFAVNVNILGQTAAMAGTDDAGTAWAASYDGRASEVLGAVNDLTLALENYGGVVIQAGYNHAVAEYNATPGNQGPPPQRPAEPASVAGVLSTPPSAGGPGMRTGGQRIRVRGAGRACRCPTETPSRSIRQPRHGIGWRRCTRPPRWSRHWKSTREHSATRGTPEVEYIAKDLRELRDATSAILAGCSELAQSCKDYRAALDDLRNQLEDILTDLSVELAVTATISVFAACVSFGAGAAAGAAKAAHTISKFARTIRSAVSAWKVSKRISTGVKKAHDIAGIRKRLERIKNLARKGKPEQPKPLPVKGNLRIEGAGFSTSERETAQELTDRGHDVVLRQANPAADRTSDLIVDGMPYDVYTPSTGSIDRLVGAIADKGTQVPGGGVVLDLRNSLLTPAQVGDLLPRVRGITDKVTEIIVLGR